jgi:CBS domain-containing protein
MICPTCGYDNLPGNEECGNCQQDLTQIDRPAAQNRVERSLMEDRVGQLHPKPAVTIRPDTTIQAAIQVMLEHDIGALLIVDSKGKLLGIFSERDLLKRVAGLHHNYADLPVASFMTANPEIVTASNTLDFALRAMDSGGYRHLPVVQGDRPVGVISVRDMLRHITRLCKDNHA